MESSWGPGLRSGSWDRVWVPDWGLASGWGSGTEWGPGPRSGSWVGVWVLDWGLGVRVGVSVAREGLGCRVRSGLHVGVQVPGWGLGPGCGCETQVGTGFWAGVQVVGGSLVSWAGVWVPAHAQVPTPPCSSRLCRMWSRVPNPQGEGPQRQHSQLCPERARLKPPSKQTVAPSSCRRKSRSLGIPRALIFRSRDPRSIRWTSSSSVSPAGDQPWAPCAAAGGTGALGGTGGSGGVLGVLRWGSVSIYMHT